MKAALLVLASIVVGLAFCEAGLRLFTHYRPGATSEPSATAIAPDKPLDLQGALPYIARMPAAPGTDRSWFTDNPPPLPNRKTVSEADQARYHDFERRGIFGPQSFYLWNRAYVEATSCGPTSWFRNYPQTILVFDPPSGGSHPIYRFPPNATTFTGLVTNQFGFRGPPLALAKPPKTIRIAFLGASTTVNNHNYPFSYPERVVYWFNRFAESNHFDVRFEVLNAGREGINSEDIPAIVREELLPLDPDLAVYYEGSNQFGSVNQLVSPSIRPRMDIDPRDPIIVHKVPAVLRAHLAAANLLDLALNGFSFIGEPRKPPYRILWPQGVDERDPNPDNPTLPLYLPVVVRDLDAVRASLAPLGGQLALCSFEWLTPQGVPLSPTRHEYIYKQLNTVLWPLRYADIRRFADFQNRVFRRYADSRKIPFLDVASSLPQDPNLFVDAIHMTDTGERVKAWIVFQKLVPLIRREIESGQLPRAAPAPLPQPPSFLASTMSLGCNQKPLGAVSRIPDGLSLYRSEAVAGSSIEVGHPWKITTIAQRYAYAAIFKINLPAAPPGRVYVHLRARTLKGQIGVGVLDQSRNYFLVERTVPVSTEMIDIYFPVPTPDRADSLVVRNADPAGARSEVLIESIELLASSEPRKK